MKRTLNQCVEKCGSAGAPLPERNLKAKINIFSLFEVLDSEYDIKNLFFQLKLKYVSYKRSGERYLSRSRGCVARFLLGLRQMKEGTLKRNSRVKIFVNQRRNM